MISPELLRLTPLFARLSASQIATIAEASGEMQVMPGEYLFREGDVLEYLYLITDGEIDIVMGITDRNIGFPFFDRLFRNIEKIDVTLETLGKGNLFGWSALVSHNYASSTGAVAVKPSQVVTFDCLALQTAFQRDYGFGYLMAQAVAQEIDHKLKHCQTDMLSTMVMKADRLYVGFTEMDHRRCISASTPIHYVV